MAQMDSDALRLQQAQLRQEHRDLDAAVEALASTSNQDALQLQRLKKSDHRFSPHAGQKGKSSSISASHDVQIPVGDEGVSDSGDVDSNRTDFSLTTGVIAASSLNSHAASKTMAS